MSAERSGTPRNLVRPQSLYERAVDASRDGQPARADRLLHQALQSLDHTSRRRDEVTLHMRILITTAKVESELRGLDDGLARLSEAAGLLVHGPDRVVLTALHNQRGTMLARAGRY